jgi:hypothetical protein
MHALGAIRMRRGGASWGSRRQFFIAQPSLQGARAGKFVISIQRFQFQQQSPGTPPGMLLAEF